jgi:hypothetical protein
MNIILEVVFQGDADCIDRDAACYPLACDQVLELLLQVEKSLFKKELCCLVSQLLVPNTSEHSQ